jgi:ParB family chromosome partitioning protein
MATELGLSHDQIGEKTGKDRVTVTNTIRLLQLAPERQELISARKLSPGHARALLKLQDSQTQREMAERCIREGWSVRQIEEYTRPTRTGNGSASQTAAKREEPPIDPNVKAAIGEMERRLGTRVRITDKGRSRGQIEIEYYSQDDLDRIYNLIVGDQP